MDITNHQDELKSYEGENLQLLLMIPSKNIKIDFDEMANQCLPKLNEAKLILMSELHDLEKKSGVCGIQNLLHSFFISILFLP